MKMKYTIPVLTMACMLVFGLTGCNLAGGTVSVSDQETAEAIAATLLEGDGGDFSLVNSEDDDDQARSLDARSLEVTRTREYQYSTVETSFTKTWYNGDWVNEVDPPEAYDRFSKVGTHIVTLNGPRMDGSMQGSMDLQILLGQTDGVDTYSMTGTTARTGDMTHPDLESQRTVTRTVDISKEYAAVVMLRDDIGDGDGQIMPLSGTVTITGEIYREATGGFGSRSEQRIIDAEITYDGSTRLRVRFRDTDTEVLIDASTGEVVADTP